MKVVPSYDRQARMFDPLEYLNTTVAIVGLGNIGSNAAVTLARMGIARFILIDHDTIEAHNLNSQHYTTKDNGKTKVEALAKQLKEINPAIVIDGRVEMYAGTPLEASVYVSAVDSMTARKAICEAMTANDYRPFVIDGRSGGGQLEVHSQVQGDWLGTLVEDADEDACGEKFIAYGSTIIGGFIANQVKRHMKGESVKSRVLFHCDTYQILTV